MRVFVTGATGFIGTAVVPELIKAGHTVLGMTRSDAGAEALLAAGAEVHRGDLTDPDSLRAGAAQADGAIHLAFNHDFSQFAANCEMDRNAITALAAGLAASHRPLPENGRPLIITSGTGMVGAGKIATELDLPTANPHMPRYLSEELAVEVASKYKDAGLRVSIMRLPQVHDPIKAGLVTYLVAIARQKGQVAYVGDGTNTWPAAHVSDVAHLYRLALERRMPADASVPRYHAVAEEGVPMRLMAESVGRGLALPVVSLTPENAPAFYGFLAMFASHDLKASSALTREWLDWKPTGPTLLEDLDKGMF
jgi:nucleoside-diphosphate-sugar epimerase